MAESVHYLKYNIVTAHKKMYFNIVFTVYTRVCIYLLLANKHNADNRRQHRNSVLITKMFCFQFSRKSVICILADLLVLLYKTRKKVMQRE